MSDILKAPFVDDFYWWAPVDLLRRLLFVTLTVALPGNPVSFVHYLTIILMCSLPYEGSSVAIDYGLCNNICIP